MDPKAEAIKISPDDLVSQDGPSPRNGEAVRTELEIVANGHGEQTLEVSNEEEEEHVPDHNPSEDGGKPTVLCQDEGNNGHRANLVQDKKFPGSKSPSFENEGDSGEAEQSTGCDNAALPLTKAADILETT